MSNGRWRFLIFAVCVALVPFWPLAAHGAVHDVSDVAGFQTALTTAQNNDDDDTINVAAGTYNVISTLTYDAAAAENYSLTIQGAGAATTTLDGGDSVQILNINTRDHPDANVVISIDGVAFVNGNSDDDGGGLEVENHDADVIVTNCRFQGNHADDWGGGAYVYAINGGDASIVTFESNTFHDNEAQNNGGGLFAWTNMDSFRAIVRNNQFTNNRVENNSGGGAYVAATAPPTGAGGLVSKNIFMSNSAYSGGGIYVQLDSDNNDNGGTLENNVFKNNSAGGPGGGVYVNINIRGTGEIVNNTCINNTASGDGGGLYFRLRDNEGGIQDSWLVTANIYNNIAWDNTASDSGDDMYVADMAGNTVAHAVNLHNNDYGADGLEYDDGSTLSEVDNINDDPLIVGVFELSSESPCIDAADAGFAPDDDIQDESRPFGAGDDIGADEFVDKDDDKLPDAWESQFGIDDPDGDEDEDGLKNSDEYLNETDPTDSDSDDDGLSDGAEVNTHGTDPTEADTDGDGLSDGQEIAFGFDPNSVCEGQGGSLFVLDNGCDCVLQIALDGSVSVAVTEEEMIAAAVAAGASPSDFDPYFEDMGITFDDTGNMYFTVRNHEEGNEGRVFKRDCAGNLTLLVKPDDIWEITGDEFNRLEGITFSKGMLYANDDGSNSVLKIDPATGDVQFHASGDDLLQLAGIDKVDLDSGITAGPGGVVYSASDREPDAIFAIASDGTPSVLVKNTGEGNPFIDLDVFMTMHPDGDIIISDDGNWDDEEAPVIYRVKTDSGKVSVFLSAEQLTAPLGAAVPPNPNTCDDNWVDLEGGIAFDSAGKFYVANEARGECDDVWFPDDILKFDSDGNGVVWVAAADVEAVTGERPDYEGGIAFAPGLAAPDFEASGEWSFTITSQNTDCPDQLSSGTVTIEQDGNYVEMEVDGQTFKGTVSGSTYNLTTQTTDPMTGETETWFVTFTLTTSASGSGVIDWTVRDDTGQRICEGSAEFDLEAEGAVRPLAAGGGGGGCCFVNTAGHGLTVGLACLFVLGLIAATLVAVIRMMSK